MHENPNRQLALPLEDAPLKVRRYGLRDAHERPLVSRGKRRDGTFPGAFRVAPAEAWRYPSLELRAGNSWPCLVLDCDGHSGTERLMTAEALGDVPRCNWIVTRQSSGGSHAVWTLKRPVHRGETARAAPLALYARVAEYLAAAVGADRGYSGVLSHNPMARPQGHDLRTTWGRCEPYDIKGELLAFVPRGWRKPRRPVTEIGRNCGLFSSLMAWAGSEANAGRDVLPVALDLNRGFDCPLDDIEVQGIARSVERYRARWIAEGRFYSAAEASEHGRVRGVRSGEARRKVVAERDAAIVDAYCAGEGTEREIAARFGLSKTAVHHILTRPDWLQPELGL